MKLFDLKYGSVFETLPQSPGVYLFKKDSVPIYVGKAKSLKRRLSQYRNASRTKRDRKKWTILKTADCLTFRVCADETAALLLENEIIQQQRPKYNIEGAFSFTYPTLGIKRDANGDLWLAYSTEPNDLQNVGYTLYGSYRSRLLVREAYRSLRFLWRFIGHRELVPRSQSIPYTSQSAWRQSAGHWDKALGAFFEGESSEVLSDLSLTLLNRPMGEADVKLVEEALKILKEFFLVEAVRLRSMVLMFESRWRFVPQAERDPLRIRVAQRDIEKGGTY